MLLGQMEVVEFCEMMSLSVGKEIQDDLSATFFVEFRRMTITMLVADIADSAILRALLTEIE